MRPALSVILLLAIGAAPARAAIPVVGITDPATFTLTQGALSAQIQAVERAQSAASFYNYFSASSHTGFEAPHESKLFLYRDTTTGALSLFITHNIDADSSGIFTGPGAVTFDMSGIPPGAFVAQSDDPNQFGRDELDITLQPEGLWNYQDNTDGGVIDGLPLDQPWCITVDPQLFSNVSSWVYHFSSGQPIVLDMSQPVTICYEVPQVDQLDVDEGNDVSLAGAFDDQDAFDTHVATWTFGDSQSAPGVYSPGVGFTHHDLDPVFHPYGDNGLFDAVLDVVDSNGDAGSDLVHVNVHNVAPSVTYTGPVTFQAGIPATLTASGVDPGSDDIGFDWDFGDGSPISSSMYFNDGANPDPAVSPLGSFPFQASDSQQHVYCEPGPVFIIVVARDDDGATSGTLVQALVDDGPGCNQPPACDAGPDLAVACWQAQVVAQASDPEGLPLAIAWSSDCPGLALNPPDALAISVVSDCDSTCTLTMTATDVEGASCSDELVITFGTQLPAILACPPPTTVECDGAGNLADHAAWMASFAADGCSIELVDKQISFAQDCGDLGTELRRFVARDACSREATCTSTFQIVDTTPPSLSAGILDECYPSVAAAEAAALAVTSASDACSEPIGMSASTTGTCQATVVVTATDACQNAASVSYSTIIDADPPQLSVPADTSVDCSAVPAPGPITVADACDPAPVVTLVESRVDGPCAASYVLTRTWTAIDHCGHPVSQAQSISVTDSSGPIVQPGSNDAACLWPPNHRMVCFGQADFAPVISEACSPPVTWIFAGCASDQPDDDLGDGSTTEDCQVSPDGLSFCVRAERQGMRPEGRHYGVGIVAIDDCGNISDVTVIGNILVPHDQNPHATCRRAARRR